MVGWRVVQLAIEVAQYLFCSLPGRQIVIDGVEFIIGINNTHIAKMDAHCT